MADTIADAPPHDGRMSLMDHLVELRSRLIKCAIAIAVGSALGWMLYNPVLSWLREPLEAISDDPNVSSKLRFLGPMDGFMFRIKMSAYLGLAICMPYLLWQLWRFISPGLYQNERRYASAFVVSATTRSRKRLQATSRSASAGATIVIDPSGSVSSCELNG